MAISIRSLILWTIATAFLLSSCEVSAPVQNPTPKMTKIVFRYAAPGAEGDSFTAKPRTLYQLGTHYQRVEELPNSETGIHALIVSNNRDTWMVNLANKTGLHLIDNATSYDVYAPVFSGYTTEYDDFIFGSELKFIQEASIEPSRVNLENQELLQYEFSSGQMRLRLMVDAITHLPRNAFLVDGDKVICEVQYDQYYAELEPNFSLFDKPNGVTYSEASSEYSQDQPTP